MSGPNKAVWQRPGATPDTLPAFVFTVRFRGRAPLCIAALLFTAGLLAPPALAAENSVANININESSAAENSGEENSAAEGPVEQLTAGELAAWVLERNPALRAAQAKAQAAAHRIEPAGSLDDPTLSYGAAPNTAGSDGGLDQRAEFSQRLPWPGTLAAREAQARQRALAAERSTDLLRLDIIAAAKSAHAEWRYIARALEIYRATRQLLNELTATAETRFAAGRASRQDVLQAEVEQLEIEKRELELRQLASSTQARINALLQRPPSSTLPPAAATSFLPQIPAAEILVARALQQHPALQRQAAQIAAQEDEVTLAEKAFYPDFQLGVGYNQLWEDPDKRAAISLSISLPLNRSKRRAELDSARAQMQSAEWELAEQRAQLLADLSQAHAQVIETRDAVQLYQNRLLPLVSDYLDAAVADYSAGSGAFLNVVTAEQRKLRTELALARARADHARAVAVLERWTGSSLPLQPAQGERR